jgi:hypothetical protein
LTAASLSEEIHHRPLKEYKKVIRKKAAVKAGSARGVGKPRLSGAKKYAIARILLSGVPASHLAGLNWGRAVRKAGGRNPFDDVIRELTPKQKRLLAIAKRTK